MANYFFIKELVFNHSFGWYESLNDRAFDQVHARSMTVINGRLEPIGFPFFIVLISAFVFLPVTFFGASIFNIVVISFVPLLAIASNFLLYGIVRRVWNVRMAFISSFLFFLIPSWWYWSGRPFQHVVPFIFFLILSIYGIVRMFDASHDSRKKICFTFLSAFGIACALAIRPTELLWVLGLYSYLLYLIRAHVSRRQFVVGGGTVFLVALLFFVTQDAFYGSPFASGYVKPVASGFAGSIFDGGQGVSFFRAFFFPFGFHSFAILKTVYHYFVLLFNLWSALLVVSCIFILLRGQSVIRNYVFVYGAVSVYLVCWYGSWNFTDNLLGIPSIGSSQTRYFMPVYVGMIVPLAYCFDRLLHVFSIKKQILMTTVLFSILLFFSYRDVFLSLPEGLSTVRNTLIENQEKQREIYTHVPMHSVVLTRFGDKYVFPGRKVLIRTEEEVWARAVKNLLESGVPVWWYDLKLGGEERDVVEQVLDREELVLGVVRVGWDNLELREVSLKK